MAGGDLAERLRTAVEDHHAGLVRALTLACGDPTEAQDAVQEAYTRLWAAWHEGTEVRSQRAWLAAVALNVVRTGWRRQGRHEAAVRMLTTTHAVDRTDLSTDAMAVGAALDRLPARQRQAVVLHYYLDLPVADTASVLGVEPGTIKNALFRARATLAQALAIEEEVAGDA